MPTMTPPPHRAAIDAVWALAGISPQQAAEKAGVPLRVIYSREASPALLARVVRLSTQPCPAEARIAMH
ncbi:hypothetical protein [Brachybacterium massiliense]|uniref:hypothetical protein n=1 Tax=Brachybacterium massiliense TaxID=1755098 RepID=UPI000B3BAEB7|nr:hypothetical protein [Brachybacterium massiliense]